MKQIVRILRWLLPALLLWAMPSVSYADNCSGLSDCYNVVQSAAAALAAMALLAFLVLNPGVVLAAASLIEGIIAGGGGLTEILIAAGELGEGGVAAEVIAAEAAGATELAGAEAAAASEGIAGAVEAAEGTEAALGTALEDEVTLDAGLGALEDEVTLDAGLGALEDEVTLDSGLGALEDEVTLDSGLGALEDEVTLTNVKPVLNPTGDVVSLSEFDASLGNVNAIGGNTNCGQVVQTVDRVLGGDLPQYALDSPKIPLNELEGKFGSEFVNSSLDGIGEQLASEGAGSRGIVYVGQGSDAHVFNAINRDGVVWFVDGQAGIASTNPGSLLSQIGYDQSLLSHLKFMLTAP